MALSSIAVTDYSSTVSDAPHGHLLSSEMMSSHEAARCGSVTPVMAQAASTDACVVSQEEFSRLQKQADRLEHLLQVMPAGVVVIDGKGIVRQANAQARDLLGEPLEGQVWRTIIDRSFSPQADDGHEVSLRDGRKVKLSISPLHNEPGQLIVLTDLTETRQLQQRISHMQRLSALGKTVASLVHQIRTPLSAAMLYAANLAGGKLTEGAQQQFADKLQARLKDLEGQVNDMLLFAKSGEKQVVEKLSVSSLLEQVTSGAESHLDKHDATLEISIAEQDLAVLGNAPALSGALLNLVHNALQHKSQGAALQILCGEDLEDARYLCIDVVDNGPGLPADKLEQIFEPFFTTRSQGTGLGLAVVQSVMKSHFGTVNASNNSHGGACFSLRLPKFTAVQPAAVTAKFDPASRGGIA